MHCPSCKTAVLQLQPPDDRPDRLGCETCGGTWIKGHAYWRWLHKVGQNLPERSAAAQADLPVTDSTQAKLCPECQHFLRRARVGHGVAFCIERCGFCGGIWLDRNEWEVLRNHNLHDDLHFIFSAAWQQRVVEEEQREVRQQRVGALLGPDFARVRDFKAWVAAHPQRSVIMAFLTDMDL